MSRVTPETAIKNQIKDYLKMRGIFVFHNLAGLGCFPGVPDLTIFHAGKVGYIEVKTKTGVVSDRQKYFMVECMNHGIDYVVARDYKDVESLLSQMEGDKMAKSFKCKCGNGKFVKTTRNTKICSACLKEYDQEGNIINA